MPTARDVAIGDGEQQAQTHNSSFSDHSLADAPSTPPTAPALRVIYNGHGSVSLPVPCADQSHVEESNMNESAEKHQQNMANNMATPHSDNEYNYCSYNGREDSAQQSSSGPRHVSYTKPHAPSFEQEEEDPLSVSVGSRSRSGCTLLNANALRLRLLPSIPDNVTDELARTDNYYVSISDPNDCSFRSQATSKFLRPYEIVCTVYFQVVAAFLYLAGCIIVLLQCFTGNGGACWYTFISVLIFSVEMGILFGFQRSSRLSLQKRFHWHFLEPVVIWLCLVLEFTSWIIWGARKHDSDRPGALVALAWLRLILWIAYGFTRWEQLQLGIRTLCSADRRRYRAEGFDLDLSYIHRNIVAMAWPATNFERFFRNPMEQVVNFLDRKHPNSYLIVNLCSERTYPSSCFHNQTSWVSMDDHNPAELEIMMKFCQEATDFIMQDPYSRMVAVHCKGGKGRTGTLICAYLMFSGLKRTSDSALHHFATLRTRYGARSFQGVQAPSQDRYVRYFEKLLQQPFLAIPSRPIRVRRLRLHCIPWLWYTAGVGKLWFVVQLKPSTERRVAFISNPSVTFNPEVPDASTYTAKQMRDLFGTDEDNLYRECNETDGENSLKYNLDTTSFWYFVNSDFTQRLDYEQFTSYMSLNHGDIISASPKDFKKAPPTLKVAMELRRPEEIPELDGDVVFKFYYARNDPNSLEPPVQFWLHTAFETGDTMFLKRDQLDGPPKDKKVKRYPMDFAIDLGIEDAHAFGGRE